MSLHAFEFLLRPLARQPLQQLTFVNTFYNDFYTQRRLLHDDGRSRLSNFWAPTGGIAKQGNEREDSHSMLIRGGFVRQAHSGLFHFLPLGLRIQEKLERLLDKHMVKLGASKVSLSTLSSEDLWTRSGRLNGDNTELFRLEDRKHAKYLLSPTHEEEITTLVGDIVKSYKDLPLRLYQISRKYRDEPRPRQGLLRTREFLMKDLYTFDHTEQDALQTYEAIRQGYSAFFDEFKIPYLVAKADTGSIGGDLSHEYHFPTSKGEDNLINCDSCSYVANEEVAKSPFLNRKHSETGKDNLFRYEAISSDVPINLFNFRVPEKMKTKVKFWYGINTHRNILYHAILPFHVANGDGSNVREAHFNPYALKAHCLDIDLGVTDPLKLFAEYTKVPQGVPLSDKRPAVERFFDYRLPPSIIEEYNTCENLISNSPKWELLHEECTSIDMVRIEAGDRCQQCEVGSLRIQKAVELGHTFLLGTRYSQPLQATVATEAVRTSVDDTEGLLDDGSPWLKAPTPSTVPIQMGCHGIGVSRMIAAVADSLADDQGLNWPRVMAPFEAVVIPAKGFEQDAVEVLDLLGTLGTKETPAIDAILDDREKEMAWKLKDADLIGYPVIVVLGRAWRRERRCEVQCRRLEGLKRDVPLGQLRQFVADLLGRL